MVIPARICFLCGAATEESISLVERADPLPLHGRCALRLAASLLNGVSGQAPPPLPGSTRLTGREQDVLDGLIQGETCAQTAQRLGLSERTVKNVVSVLLSKLGARTRAQAVAIAVRAHLWSEPPTDRKNIAGSTDI